MASPAAAGTADATMEWVISELRATRTATNEQRALVTARLVENASSPQFNSYLVRIMASHPGPIDMPTRQLAGLLLKQNAEKHFAAWPADVQAFIKNEVQAAMGHADRHIRSTVGTVISSIISAVRIPAWPELLGIIAKNLDPAAQETCMDGALRTAAMLCEDWPEDINSERLGYPLNTLLPKFILFFKHPNPLFRRLALQCCINFIIEMPAAMVTNMAAYLAGLSAMTTDTDPQVRKLVCNSIVAMTEERLDLLMPHIVHILAFMKHSMSDKDERVQLAACEFWANFLDSADSHAGMLGEHFPALVPLLVKCCEYGEEELADLPVDDVADEAVADRQEDIAPFIYRSHRGGGDNDDGSVDVWNLRRCAAYTLDALARYFKNTLLAALLPELNARFACNGDSQWLYRESGILAFGAVVRGCMDEFMPCFPALYPHLLGLLDNKRPLIRSISAWALSRMAPWVADQADDATYTHALLGKLCAHILDHNKKVQESACSCFASLAEYAGPKLAQFAGPILDTLNAAFSKYQAKNIFILYDALGTFCDSLGAEHLNKPVYISKVLAPLVARWNGLQDDDRQLCPLLECMASVVRALGPGFAAAAATVYTRCLRLLESNLVTIKAAEDAHESLGEGDSLRDFVVLSLDMLSAMCEGLGPHVAKLVAGSNVLALVHECMRDSNESVRQSACAVIGDIAQTAPELVVPAWKDILGMLVANVRVETEYVCNNASWAIGNLAMRLPAQMQPFAPHVMPKLVAVLNTSDISLELVENISISIGRLALACPAEVQPFVASFAAQWVASLRHISDDEEKAHTFRGLFEMLKVEPAAIAPHFRLLCDAIAGWVEAPAEMKALCQTLITAFKTMAGDTWPSVVASLHAETRSILNVQYSL